MKNLLLPESYIVRSKYLTHWSYRVTWYIILAGLIVNSVMILSWKKMQEVEKESQEVAMALTQSEAELSRKKTELAPVIEKYKKVIGWQSLKRLPLAPILEALEKNSTNDSALVSFKWDLTKGQGGRREGRVGLGFFVSEIGGANLPPEHPWLTSLRRALEFYKIEYGNFKISDGTAIDGGTLFDVNFDIAYGKGGTQ
jgi:hypothetical protein